MQFTDFVNLIQKWRYYNMNRCILCTQAWFSHAGLQIAVMALEK